MLVLAILKPCIEVLAATDPSGIPQEPRMANTRQKKADSHTSLDTLPSTLVFLRSYYIKAQGFLSKDMVRYLTKICNFLPFEKNYVMHLLTMKSFVQNIAFRAN